MSAPVKLFAFVAVLALPGAGAAIAGIGIFGDFKFAGEAVALASDLRVEGRADLKPLPAATAVATNGHPTAGRSRLFLQFEHDGRIQTVAYTQEVNQS